MSSFNVKFIKKLTSKSKIYLLIISILSIILCIYDLKWIIPSILLIISLGVYATLDQSRKVNEIENHLEELTTDVNSATKNNLINSPIPLVLIETDGNILWKSKTFISEFNNTDINTYLIPVVKEIKLDIEKSNENKKEIKEITKQFNIDGKIYKIRGEISRSKKRDKRRKKEYLLTLYFIDETKYNELFDDYNNSKTCIGVAIVDNYEEILKTALPEDRISLMANIEKEIMDWASETGGLIVKTEKDTFIYIFEQKYLAKMEEEKFNILDRVKKIDADSKIQVTLSIAICNEGKNNYEKYKNALASMEIVLGRGGDQAVVRKNGKYKFYGGKTVELEKRTKVKARTVSHAITNLINKSEKVIIMGHKNIDIDAMGSALGFYRICTFLDKEAYIATEPEGKSLEKFMMALKQDSEYENIVIGRNEALKKINSNTLLIIVDTHKIGYVEFPELLEQTEKKVIVDHHRKSTDCIEGALINFHEVYASSTSELVSEIIQYSQDDIELKLIEAESLYGGIMVDTKDFTFKTGVRTFESAAYLRKFGVDIIKVKKWFQADLESYNEIAQIVKNSEIIEQNIAVSIYDKEDESTNLICAKAADELLTISDITASFVIGKLGDKIFISGRSIGDINVQIILEKLGGGGHITLAGAQLEGLTLEEAYNELVIRINEYLTEIS
ncbi:MAG: DHH family phosphoesterase [Candidatus Scatovivens sp.]